jgi:hypothetical protein
MNIEEQCNSLIRIAEDIARSFRPIDDKHAGNHIYKILVLHLFNKSWRTFESIHLLCVNRFGQEAAILLRSFLEVVVNAIYISKAPSTRSILFAEYGYLEKMSFRRAVLEFQNVNPKDEWVNRIVSSNDSEGVESDKKEYERVKNNYPKRNSWSGKSIKEMAIESGMHLHYILYKMFCNVAHFSSMGTASYFTIEGGTIKFTADVDGDIHARWHTACVYLYSIMSLVNETFELRFDDRLKAVSEMLLERKSTG